MDSTSQDREGAGQLARVDRMGKGALPGVLAALMALTSDAVLTLDGDARILTANAQAEALTELSLDELVGTSVRDILFNPNHPSDAGAYVPLLPTDGSLTELSCRLASGGAATVAARCDRVSAPGETYLLVMRPTDALLAAERDHDRLLDELSLANRRLSGTLRIVLDTIDADDVESLFGGVLEQMTDTLDAHGALLFVAESSGYRLGASTASLEGRRLPQYMAYGEGLETIVTRAGNALRLRLLPPSEQSLRAGALATRELLDEESGERHAVPARQVPPFTSLICVPVWFGGHVIAIIEVGWAEARPTRRDDARLLDSVSQYLSIEFAAAISTIRTERAQRLDRAAQKLGEVLEDGPDVDEDALSRVRETLASELGVEVAPVTTEPFEDTCVASVPGVGDVELPRPLGELTRGYADAGVAVAPIGRGSALATWLAHAGKPCTGALIDLGEIAGRRRVFLVMRAADEEPVDGEEFDFLRRVCIDVRQAVEEGERRVHDTRISRRSRVA